MVGIRITDFLIGFINGRCNRRADIWKVASNSLDLEIKTSPRRKLNDSPIIYMAGDKMLYVTASALPKRLQLF
jgi:hypothetical protein